LQRKGLIETAAGGTLFLDEIGELPPPFQMKLLRFLQDKRIQRVGGRQEIEINARIIAATNSDLKKAIVNGNISRRFVLSAGRRGARFASAS
jgi:two-component system NtrC family response regulator